MQDQHLVTIFNNLLGLVGFVYHVKVLLHLETPYHADKLPDVLK